MKYLHTLDGRAVSELVARENNRYEGEPDPVNEPTPEKPEKTEN